jgi:hypothetical protein
VTWGTDDSAAIQSALTYASSNGWSAIIPAGRYLLGTGLRWMPPTWANGAQTPAPGLLLDTATILMAVKSMTSIIQYGDDTSDYLGFLRNGTFGGGVLDGNFLAQYGADFPMGYQVSRQNQITKNTLHAGVRWGRTGAPDTMSGSFDFDIVHMRDTFTLPVDSITATGLVTTHWDHGFTDGRVVTFFNQPGGSAAGNVLAQYFQISVIVGATNTFQLVNPPSPVTLSGSGLACDQCMPSMSVSVPIAGIDSTNPGGVQTSVPHGYVDNDVVWVGEAFSTLGQMNLGGKYTVTVKDSTHFTVGVDWTGAGTYSAHGCVQKWPDPATAECGVWYENTADMDFVTGDINGVRYGIVSNPVQGGWDGKVIKPHVWNDNQSGEVFAAISLGGDNELLACQFDCPMYYCAQFTGVRNQVKGCHFDYADSSGKLALFHNHASFIRLEPGASAVAIGCGIKGDGRWVLSEVSANGAVYWVTQGYQRLGVTGYNTTYNFADSVMQGGFLVKNPVGNGTMLVTGGSNPVVIMAGSGGGIALNAASGGGNLYGTDANGIYTYTAITMTLGAIEMQQPLRVNNAFVAGAPAPTGYITIQDSNGTTYKVPVAP